MDDVARRVPVGEMLAVVGPVAPSPTQNLTVPQVQIGVAAHPQQDRRHHRDEGQRDIPIAARDEPADEVVSTRHVPSARGCRMTIGARGAESRNRISQIEPSVAARPRPRSRRCHRSSAASVDSIRSDEGRPIELRRGETAGRRAERANRPDMRTRGRSPSIATQPERQRAGAGRGGARGGERAQDAIVIGFSRGPSPHGGGRPGEAPSPAAPRSRAPARSESRAGPARRGRADRCASDNPPDRPASIRHGACRAADVPIGDRWLLGAVDGGVEQLDRRIGERPATRRLTRPGEGLGDQHSAAVALQHLLSFSTVR